MDITYVVSTYRKFSVLLFANSVFSDVTLCFNFLAGGRCTYKVMIKTLKNTSINPEGVVGVGLSLSEVAQGRQVCFTCVYMLNGKDAKAYVYVGEKAIRVITGDAGSYTDSIYTYAQFMAWVPGDSVFYLMGETGVIAPGYSCKCKDLLKFLDYLQG